jgi:hypothetical protein
MKKCYAIEFRLDDDFNIAMKACGNDQLARSRVTRVRLGNAGQPAELLEIALLRALGRLRRSGWAFMELEFLAETALSRLARFLGRLRRPTERGPVARPPRDPRRRRQAIVAGLGPLLAEGQYVFVVTDDIRERAVAERLQDGRNWVKAFRSSLFLREPDDPSEVWLKFRAIAAMQIASEGVDLSGIGQDGPGCSN